MKSATQAPQVQNVIQEEITDSSSQASILAKIGLLKNFLEGKVLLACSKLVGDGNTVRCMFVQNRPDAQRPDRSNGTLLSASMGWNNSGRMLRCWHNFDLAIFEGISPEDVNDGTPNTADEIFAKIEKFSGITLGLEGQIGISIVEDSSPNTWIDTKSGEERVQAPLINPQTQKAITSKGHPVYAHTQLAVGDAVETVILTLDKQAEISK